MEKKKNHPSVMSQRELTKSALVRQLPNMFKLKQGIAFGNFSNFFFGGGCKQRAKFEVFAIIRNMRLLGGSLECKI